MRFEKLTALAGILATLAACNGLSDDAKRIAGNYYIPEISDSEPLFELRPDGSATIRAIKPQVLTYSVDGVWNVENDSLIARLDPSTLKWSGDSTLIGDIPDVYARRIVDAADLSLTLESEGIHYVYHRRK